MCFSPKNEVRFLVWPSNMYFRVKQSCSKGKFIFSGIFSNIIKHWNPWLVENWLCKQNTSPLSSRYTVLKRGDDRIKSIYIATFFYHKIISRIQCIDKEIFQKFPFFFGPILNGTPWWSVVGKLSKVGFHYLATNGSPWCTVSKSHKRAVVISIICD